MRPSSGSRVAKRAATRRKSTPGAGLHLRFRDRDSACGVTRRTTALMAETLGLSETQVVHLALANLARQTLPGYEADNGPLSAEQLAAIGKLVPQGRLKASKRLF